MINAAGSRNWKDSDASYDVWFIRILAIVVTAGGAGLPQVTAESPARVAAVSDDPHDWPMYNRDVVGTRHNSAEKSLSQENAGQLVERWRFPAADADEKIGVVHATVVVDGYVYFGTLTFPTFYKLTPDGQLKWMYRNPAFEGRAEPSSSILGLPTSGFMNAAAVTSDTVYVGDIGGYIYALDRATGQERWTINTRNAPFPGAHPSNCIFSAPILADGKVVVAGGAYEHAVAAAPNNRGCTGRGFVVALDPITGAVIWKYDVGPEPKEFTQPVTIKDARGEHVFHRGPSTGSVWCTPSYDAERRMIYFGTDCHNSPREPTPDDPRFYTKHSCAVIAVEAASGAEKWVTQINPDDVWNYSLRAYDSTTGRYKDQSIGDTPKIYHINVDGTATKVVGCGCKNGGFYVFHALTGEMLHHTPVYTGPPVDSPTLDPRTLALPSPIGGLQTGCATDGKAIFTNGIDMLRRAASDRVIPPTGGRVVSISLDTRHENWRHERPKVKSVGGTKDQPAFTDVGDPVASGIALANGVAYLTSTMSNKLVALGTATGEVLKEIDVGPVWCGPTVSRGRVYVGTGNLLIGRDAFPKSPTGTVRSYGLPGEDEVSRLGGGNE